MHTENHCCRTWRVADVRCWPSIPPLVYISNIEYFVKLKSWLRILFLSHGTNAVWGFNFLRVGVLKPFQLLKCTLAGGKKGKLFCNFFYCKCACLCACACYNLRIPCFILSGGCRKYVKLSYNFTDARYNFTDARYNFADACRNFTDARCNFADACRNFTDSRYNFTDARYNFAGGYYIKKVAYFIKLLIACKL